MIDEKYEKSKVSLRIYSLYYKHQIIYKYNKIDWLKIINQNIIFFLYNEYV